MNFQNIVSSIRQKAFLPSKPIREIRPIDLKRDPEIIGSRKYNGNMASAVTDGTTQFFTASNLPLATLEGKRWVQDPEWRRTMENLPANSVLLGEVHIPSATMEDLGAFQTWYTWHMNGLEGTDANPPQLAKFRVFDILAWDGRSVAELPYRERFAMIPEAIRVEQAPYTRLHEAIEAVEVARQTGIEGFVFWDANASSCCKLSGQNKARTGAWKVKPLYKEPFAVLGFVNPDPARLIVRLGNPTVEFNCGSGLTPELRRELINRFNSGKPVVVTVGHYGLDESGKPEIPVMLEFA